MGNPIHFGSEFEAFFKTRIVHGGLVKAPTTGSTQATGTGASDYNVNIDHVLAVIDGSPYETTVQADFDLASSSAAQMASGESRIYTIVLYKSLGDAVIRWRVFAGDAATAGQEQAVAASVITAAFAEETPYIKVADVTVNRDGDQSVAQTYDNTVRNLQVPTTVHSS